MKLRNKKTGISGCIEYVMRTINPETGEPLLTVRYKDDTGVTCYIDYETVAEFNENWEDAEQPLIKDEKVRKVVRAWADINGLCKFKIYNQFSMRYLIEGSSGENGLISLNIELLGKISEVEVGRFYTITELCGEEE